MIHVEVDHELKTWPEPFAAVWDHWKTFEVRKNDRDFVRWDAVRLREWDPETARYSGRSVTVEITYVLPAGSWATDSEHVIFAFREIGRNVSALAEDAARDALRADALIAALDT